MPSVESPFSGIDLPPGPTALVPSTISISAGAHPAPADAAHRNSPCMGPHRGDRRFEPLPCSGRPDIDRIGPIGPERHAGALLRSRGAALDEAADGETMVAPVDQLAGQLGLFRPTD